MMQELFGRSERYMQRQGYQARKGQIVHATIVPLPRQRNRARRTGRSKRVRRLSVATEPARLRQKDVDARWAVKEGQHHYGYKNHLSVVCSTASYAAMR